MELKLNKRRGLELANFLKCKPGEVGDVKVYGKMQRVRMALEVGVGEYRTKTEGQISRAQEEAKVWNEELTGYSVEPEFKDEVEKKEWREKRDSVQRRVNAEFQKAMKPMIDEFNSWESVAGKEEVEVTVNEEDRGEVRRFFEKKGHEFWLEGMRTWRWRSF